MNGGIVFDRETARTLGYRVTFWNLFLYLTLGLVIAFATTRLLRTLVVGVSPTDVLTLGSVSASLMVVALVASYIPARRASRVDPVQAIRAD